MELWRYYRILWRRKWLIILGMVICVGSVGIYNHTSKQLWMGSVKVMERTPAQRGVPVYGDMYRGEANLQVHLNDLGVIATSEKVLIGAARTLQYLAVSAEPDMLLRTVKVQPVPDTQVLQIQVVSPSAEEAKNAADVIAREFQDVYSEIMNEPTTKSREFIESRLPMAKDQLSDIRNQIREFKETTGIVQLGQQSQIAINRVNQYRDELTRSQIDEMQAVASLQVTDEQMADLPDLREAARAVTQNPIYVDLSKQLSDGYTEIAKMEERYHEEYPDLKMLKDKVRGIEEEIKSIEPTIISSRTTTPNPLYDSVLERHKSAQASRVISAARRSAYQQAMAEVMPDMAALPAREMELAQLMVDEEAAANTYRLLRQKLDEARIKESESKNESTIKIVDEAYARQVDDKQRLKLGLALLLSPMLSAALVFILHYLDNTIRTPAEAEELLGLPVFAVVPKNRRHSLVKHKDPKALREIYQILSANLWNSLNSSDSSCVMVASAEPDSGRSVTASNLAVTLAADGARVILVDSDLRQPAQHLLFGLDNKYGFSNVLSGAALIEDVLQPTKYDGLLVMTSGPLPENPVKLLRSPQMKTFVDQISMVADFVIFDSPSGAAFADSPLIASHVKNVVVVHAAGRTPRGAEEELRFRLEQVGANLIGATLNMVHIEDSHGFFHYRRAYQDALPPNGKGGRQLAGVGSPRAIPTDTLYDDDVSSGKQR